MENIMENELILKEPFNEEKIIELLIEKFLPDNFRPSEQEFDVSDKFEKIKKVKHIGKSEKDEERPEIHLIVIEHTGTNDPRITITRETFKIVRDYRFKNTIAIYHTPDSPNYRISLITMDVVQKTETKAGVEFSNPKRFSYFLGPDAKVHTPTENLIKKGKVKSEEDLKQRFSLEVVTKEFYTELQNWYFWAMDKVKFPENPEIKDNPKNATNLIRLITRLMFVWFLKEKKLIPETLFNESELKKIVKDFNKNKSSDYYYNAILQNLFFATLNRPVDQRKFAKDEGFIKNRDNYGIKNLYRYENMFSIAEKEILELFSSIPFVNGGLFDCLDDDMDGKLIDGFTRRKKGGEELRTKIPDYLFFKEEETGLDLSKYIEKGKNAKVRGLVEILKTYHFTVDENSPIDQEISLDPEMLGMVFENLLASYNPETSQTARKSTGSYYTPREIVDYMVQESLFNYFKTKLPDIPDKKLRTLFSYFNDEDIKFSDEEKNKIIKVIDKCKVLDPAVGSGAFPMGILHKFVMLLEKIDSDNKLWQEIQYKKILEEYKTLESDTEKDEKIKELNEIFDETLNNTNYSRKLYLIENSIYGVDIQPIAVQIAKLRFFISLLIEQKTNTDKAKNYGITPLPNLETKFVCSNTLISLERPDNIFYTDKLQELEDKLKELRHRYFRIKTRTEKKKIQEKDRKIREEILNELKLLSFPQESAEKIANFDIFNQNVSNSWFDPEWMFGIKDGFDIVIGNPPYGNLIKDKNVINNFSYYDSRKNSASFFIEKGKKLTNYNGIICFIIPKSLTFSNGWGVTRNFVVYENNLNNIVDVSKAFEKVKLEQVIINFINNKNKNNYDFYVGEGWNKGIQIFGKVNSSIVNNIQILPIYINEAKYEIFKKVNINSVNLSSISETFRGLPFQNKISEKGNTFILRGDNIGKYVVYAVKCKIHFKNEENKKIGLLKNKKIVSQNIVAHVMNPYDRILIMAALEEEGLLTLDTVMNTFIKDKRFSYEYVLGVLNSKFAEWFYYWFVYNRAIRTMHFDEYYMGKLPIKIPNSNNYGIIEEIEILVKEILISKKQNPQSDTSHLETQIDQLVYKLYNLTPEEIKIIEGGKENEYSRN